MFNLSSNDSFSYFAKTISKINILQWAGLRHSIPDFLKGDFSSPLSTTPSFLIHNNIFDVTKKKSKDYYLLLVTEKAQPPNITHKWKSDLNLSDDNLRELFCYLTRSRSNRMSRLSSTKCFTIYFIQIKNYSKLGSEQTMFALFVRLDKKPYTIYFTNAPTRGDSGTILNLIGIF